MFERITEVEQHTMVQIILLRMFLVKEGVSLQEKNLQNMFFTMYKKLGVTGERGKEERRVGRGKGIKKKIKRKITFNR